MTLSVKGKRKRWKGNSLFDENRLCVGEFPAAKPVLHSLFMPYLRSGSPHRGILSGHPYLTNRSISLKQLTVLNSEGHQLAKEGTYGKELTELSLPSRAISRPWRYICCRFCSTCSQVVFKYLSYQSHGPLSLDDSTFELERVGNSAASSTVRWFIFLLIFHVCSIRVSEQLPGSLILLRLCYTSEKVNNFRS